MTYLEKEPNSLTSTFDNREKVEEKPEEKSTRHKKHSSMVSIENAVEKFLGDFTTLKSEISELKQTILSPTEKREATEMF